MILERACAFEPSRRYQNAAHLKRDLLQYQYQRESYLMFEEKTEKVQLPTDISFKGDHRENTKGEKPRIPLIAMGIAAGIIVMVIGIIIGVRLSGTNKKNANDEENIAEITNTPTNTPILEPTNTAVPDPTFKNKAIELMQKGLYKEAAMELESLPENEDVEALSTECEIMKRWYPIYECLSEHTTIKGIDCVTHSKEEREKIEGLSYDDIQITEFDPKEPGLTNCSKNSPSSAGRG